MTTHPRRSKHTPIRIGDNFKMDSGVWEVTGTAPGGRVYLFNREKSRFLDTYTKQMRDWERV